MVTVRDDNSTLFRGNNTDIYTDYYYYHLEVSIRVFIIMLILIVIVSVLIIDALLSDNMNLCSMLYIQREPCKKYYLLNVFFATSI